METTDDVGRSQRRSLPGRGDSEKEWPVSREVTNVSIYTFISPLLNYLPISLLLSHFLLSIFLFSQTTNRFSQAIKFVSTEPTESALYFYPDEVTLKPCIFVAVSHQTRLDTRSKARGPIKVGIKGRGRSGTSRDSNPACLCCSSAHLVQCEPDEASSFTNPNVSPGTYASLRLKLDAWSSAVQGGQRRQKMQLAHQKVA